MDAELYKTINKARLSLMHGKKTLVVIRDGKMLHHSDARGMTPLFNLITTDRDALKCSVVGDKIMGRAAALLCVHAAVKAVFAMTMSEEAIEILQRHCVLPTWQTTVAYVVEKDLSSRYKLDLHLKNVDDAGEAFVKIGEYLAAAPDEAGQ